MPANKIDEIDPRVPNTSTAWQLWHSDMFDRDAPSTLQASGTNILQGLYELWLYTLNEGILDNGSASFSRFHLTWGSTPATRVDVTIDPFNNRALLKLRRWAGYTSRDQENEGRQAGRRLQEQRDAILLRLAQLHYGLLKKSIRWKASAIDWGAESKEVLGRVAWVSDPKEL